MEETTRDTYIKQHTTSLWGKWKRHRQQKFGEEIHWLLPRPEFHNSIKKKTTPAWPFTLGTSACVGEKLIAEQAAEDNKRKISFNSSDYTGSYVHMRRSEGSECTNPQQGLWMCVSDVWARIHTAVTPPCFQFPPQPWNNRPLTWVTYCIPSSCPLSKTCLLLVYLCSGTEPAVQCHIPCVI